MDGLCSFCGVLNSETHTCPQMVKSLREQLATAERTVSQIKEEHDWLVETVVDLTVQGCSDSHGFLGHMHLSTYEDVFAHFGIENSVVTLEEFRQHVAAYFGGDKPKETTG